MEFKDYRCGSGGFSDFFSELFGSHMGRRLGRGAHFQSRGEDHHAKIMLDMEDAFHGAVRTISRQVPCVDECGRVARAVDKLEVRIPKGVREGQLIRLPRHASRAQ